MTLPAANLKDLLVSPLSPTGKMLALWLAAEGAQSRNECGAALKLHPHEVEAACRDLARPQVRWLPVQFDSSKLELLDTCPLKKLFAETPAPKKKDTSK